MVRGAALAGAAAAGALAHASAPRRRGGTEPSSHARDRLLKTSPPAADAPGVTTASIVLEPYMRTLVELLGSDLHCKVGSPPRVRIDGTLRKLQAPVLTPADTEQMLSEVLRPDLQEQFARTNEVDFAYSVSGVGRFRVNAMRSADRSASCCGGCRARSPFEELGLPPVVGELREPARPRARHRPDRVRQDDDARRDDRLHQRDARRAHRHDRGSRSRSCTRTSRDGQPARGRHRHRRLLRRAAGRDAPGPRRDPRR